MAIAKTLNCKALSESYMPSVLMVLTSHKKERSGFALKRPCTSVSWVMYSIISNLIAVSCQRQR